MASLLDRVDIDRISKEAREIRIGRTLLTLIAALLYVVGWTAAKVVIVMLVALRVLAVALAWTFAATRLGWQDAWASSARRRQPRPA